jgi:hypothetical protein
LLPKFCEPTGVTSYEWKNGGDRKDFGLWFLEVYNLFFVGKVRTISSEMSWLKLRHKQNFKRKV